MQREEICEKLKEIVLRNIDREQLPDERLDFDVDLKTIGIKSIQFMKLIVAIEQEFDFEFDDEGLLAENYYCLNDIAAYIGSRVEE